MWLAAGLVLLCLLQYTTTQQGGIYDCPSTWKAFSDKCYKFEVWEDTLDEATSACATDGATLVSVNSPDEHDFIAQQLADVAKENRDWYTSGKKNEGDNRFTWEGDGTPVDGGTQHWLSEDARAEEGDRILYSTTGGDWGWKVGPSMEANQPKPRPYICEISKADVYKITEEDRDFGYGIAETDPSKYERGTHFIKQPHDVLFDPTSNFNYLTIDCVADANPAPTYRWFRKTAGDDVPILPSENTRVTIINGKLALTDPDDAVGDNGEYQCRAGNKFGEILSNTVIVSFGYLNDFPKSSRDPVYVSAFQGTGIECNPPAHGYPGLYYSWLKDGQFIYTDRKPYIFISLNGKLYFSSVTKDDEGYYQCLITVPESQYSHNGGKQSQPIDLFVYESLGSERPPQIESGFPAVFPSSPKVGDNVTIECFARGYSSEIDGMQYSWERVGDSLPDNARLQDFNRVLMITNIQFINAGEYKCNVRLQRDSGQDSASVVVPVESEPYFTIPLRDQHIDEGATLNWECIADGRPEISYSWYRNGVELEEDLEEEDMPRYSISNNVLTITGADPDRDPGMYQCAATNTRATRYSSAQLRILSFAPSFAKHPLQERTYATLRGNVTLLCTPEAAPAATKEWYKDNRLLSLSNNAFDRMYALPNGNMRITGVRESDQGDYRCKATNIHGEAESEGTLTVLPTTQITHPPIQTTVQVNRTAFFHCEASYNPALDITYDWYHNDYHIEFIKIRIIGDYPHIEREEYFERGSGINRGGLYIRNVQYYHQGIYTCFAKTTTDEVSAPARLIVVGPPFMPVGIEVNTVTASSCRVRWKMGINADNGGSISNYYVEKKHIDDTEWRRATGPVRGTIDPTTMHTTVSDLTPASTYTFRVRAENEFGIGDPSMPSESITTLDAPPTTAPQMVGRCINKVGTLCITWQAVPLSERNGDGFGYQVQYKSSYVIDEEWAVVNITDPEQTQFVLTVGQSNTFKNYDVQVRSMNKMGFGPASPQVTIKSAMDIPAVQARNLRIWQVNATALLAEWDAVDPNFEGTNPGMRGTLKGFRINYWRDCCESEEMAIFNQVTGQVDNGMIIGLYPDTYYWITIQVYNEAGYGPKSDPYLQETLRAAPMEAPQEVKVYVEGSRSVRVKWRGVSTGINEEPLEGYIIRYWRQSENRYMSSDVDTYKKTNYVVDGLEKNVMYEMRVLGYSRGGDGLMSSPIIQVILGKNCEVREDSPDKDYIYKCKGETGSAAIPSISLVSLFITAVLHRIITHL